MLKWALVVAVMCGDPAPGWFKCDATLQTYKTQNECAEAMQAFGDHVSDGETWHQRHPLSIFCVPVGSP